VVGPQNKKVLSNINLSFRPGAESGVFSYNGAGKWTLLRIMPGVDTDFQGGARLADGATVGYMPQEPELDATKDVRGNIEDGLGRVKELITRFEELSMNYSEETAEECERLQHEIDALDGWNIDTKVDFAMDALRVPPGDADVT